MVARRVPHVLVIDPSINRSIQDDDFTKFHDHETWAGKLLVYFRLLLAALYLFCFLVTVRKQAQRSG